jgi:hypothetical protein
MLPWIMAGLVAVAGIIGCATGFLLAVFHGGRLAHDYADWRAASCPTCTPDTVAEDEEDRLDALAIRDLIQTVQPIAINEDVFRLPHVGEAAALHRALATARDRFADWIEWAEGVPVSETALDEDDEEEVDELDVDLTQPHERLDEEDDDPYADLTNRDVDPEAVYATEDDDFYEERVEARDGAV